MGKEREGGRERGKEREMRKERGRSKDHLHSVIFVLDSLRDLLQSLLLPFLLLFVLIMLQSVNGPLIAIVDVIQVPNSIVRKLFHTKISGPFKVI